MRFDGSWLADTPGAGEGRCTGPSSPFSNVYPMVYPGDFDGFMLSWNQPLSI
jgi:hypothetical protein